MNEINELADLAAEVQSDGYDHDEALARYAKIEELAAARNRALGEALHLELLRSEAAHRRQSYAIETKGVETLEIEA